VHVKPTASMMTLARFAILASVLTLPFAHSHADSAADSSTDPAATVRGYFEALGRNDFNRAISLTAGSAQQRTLRMVGTLKQQAAAAQAKVELQVKRVAVSHPPPERMAEGLPVPVDVEFDIAVVGRKWFFSKVARHLAGRAQFYVAAALPTPRIIAIEGKIE
jgi:hypothetical protein